MGIWKEIKYALNSTLGTKDFAPLNKMIIQQTRLVPSDELYATLQDISATSNTNSSATTYYPTKLIMKKYGSLVLKGSISKMSNKLAGNLKIYKNSNVIYEQSLKKDETFDDVEFSKIIDVVPNDIITISVHAGLSNIGTASVSVRNMGIYASFKETAFLEEPRTEG